MFKALVDAEETVTEKESEIPPNVGDETVVVVDLVLEDEKPGNLHILMCQGESIHFRLSVIKERCFGVQDVLVPEARRQTS